jgi:hypothetical protein
MCKLSVKQCAVQKQTMAKLIKLQMKGIQPDHVRPKMLGSVAKSTKQSICSSTVLHCVPTYKREQQMLEEEKKEDKIIYLGARASSFLSNNMSSATFITTLVSEK